MNLFFPTEVETKDNPGTREFHPEIRRTDLLDLELTRNFCSALPAVRTPAMGRDRRLQQLPWQLQLLGLTQMTNLAPSSYLAADSNPEHRNKVKVRTSVDCTEPRNTPTWRGP